MNVDSTARSSWLPAIVVGLALFTLAAVSWPVRRGSDALVVYCAHDSVYSQQILDEFQRDTGIPLIVRFDTEATKSLGLVNLLIAEKDNPQCDVFWNNEVLGTMRLKRAGVLQSFDPAARSGIPEQWCDPDGCWAGFGARMRVWIVNTEQLEPAQTAIDAVLQSTPGRVAMARPLYGTTLTHYSLLWQSLGGDALKTWHHQLRESGLLEVNGNAMSKNLVAGGQCCAGWTDTDDYFLAVDDGKAVAMLPARTPEGQTICIPNTVAVIRGTRKREHAERLVAWLLSEEVEVRLANSSSRQIPLGPVDKSRLPEQVRNLLPYVAEAAPLTSLEAAHSACLEWLVSEYAR